MSQIVCPNCQSPQPAGAAFCGNCGHSLASPGTASVSAPPTPFLLEIDPDNPPPGVQLCGACNALNYAEARFCDQCGSPLGPSTEPRRATIDLPNKNLHEAGALVSPGDPTLPDSRRPRRDVVRRLTIEPTGARLEFPPARLEFFVGREDPVSNIFPEIDLTSHGGERAGVSRRHARFSLDAGVLLLEDLDSTNFTFVNRKRVMPGTRQVVRNGDELRFGRITARYEEL